MTFGDVLQQVVFIKNHYYNLNWELIYRKFQISLYWKISNNFIRLANQVDQ